jgi:hypothetical protein
MNIGRRALLIGGTGFTAGLAAAASLQAFQSGSPNSAAAAGYGRVGFAPPGTGLDKRNVLRAEALVRLDLGDDAAKDNTAALQTLMDRPTAAHEIVQFPKGVIFTDTVRGRSNVHWRGTGPETVFRWRDQRFAVESPRKSAFEFVRADGFVMENFVIDGRRDAHRAEQGEGKFGKVETLNSKECRSFFIVGVESRDSLGDGFDSDNDDGGTYINCIVRNPRKDGFHASFHSQNNLYLGCFAEKTGGARGGFSSSERATGKHVFAGCMALACSRNWSVRANAAGKTAALLWCWSIDGREPDHLDGATDDLPPSPAKERLLALLAAKSSARI